MKNAREDVKGSPSTRYNISPRFLNVDNSVPIKREPTLPIQLAQATGATVRRCKDPLEQYGGIPSS